MTINEDSEIEQSDNDCIDNLKNTTSLKMMNHSSSGSSHSNSSPKKRRNRGSPKKRGKSLKKRTYDSDGKEVSPESKEDDKDYKPKKKPPKLLKIDSLLLDPDNKPEVKHDAQYSLDSWPSEMDYQPPEPTAEDKLRYHLTEPRQPETIGRRKTYAYSHDVQ